MLAAKALLTWLEAGQQGPCVLVQDLRTGNNWLQAELSSVHLLAIVRAEAACRPGQRVLVDQHGEMIVR